MSKRWLGLLIFASWIGSSGAAYAQVTNAARISVTPNGPLGFGNVGVGVTSTPQRLTVRNTGDQPLMISSAAFTATPANYVVTDAPSADPVVLDPNDTATWDIACHPLSLGPHNETFRFESNANPGGTTNVQLTCTGIGGQIATNPTPTLSFGNVAQGVPQVQTLHLLNTGGVMVTGVSGGLTDTSGAYQLTTAIPTSLAPGVDVPLTVIFTPQSGADNVTASIAFAGVWGASDTATTASVTLTGNGLGVSFTASPTIDFASFRFDSHPQRMYQIRNTGEIDISIDSATFTGTMGTVGSEVAFTFTRGGSPVNLSETLGPGQVLDVNAVAQVNNRIGPVTGNVVVHSNTTAALDQTVQITGTSTSAVVAATVMVDFLAVDVDAAATSQMITIMNTGDALLDITRVMNMDVNQAFTIGTASKNPVPIGDSASVLVTYKPTIEKAAGDGDTGVVIVEFAGALNMPRAMVPIRGRGIDRHLMSPSALAFEPTFRNPDNPARKVFTIENTGEAPLHITAVTVEGAPVWQLPGVTASEANPITIDGKGAKDFEATFTPPTTAGPVPEGRIIFTTDDNDHRTVAVTLSGDALFVDVHGGGGCSTGGAEGGGLLAIGLATLGMLRRRRRTAGAMRGGVSSIATARTRVEGAAGIAAIAAAFAAGSLGTPARADGVDLTVFEPTPATVRSGFQLESPEVGANGSWVATSVLSYASNSLVLEAFTSTGESFGRNALVKQSTQLQLGAAYALFGRAELGAHIPLYMQSGETEPGFNESPADGGATGNLTLHGKMRLVRSGGVVIGAAASAVVPTATKGQFTGSDKAEVRLLALGSFAAGPLTIAGNAGPILRGTTEYATVVQQSGIAWGVGASYRMGKGLAASLELFGEATPSGKSDEMANKQVLSPIEALAGVTVRLHERIALGVAAGRGVTDAVGTPGVRGVLSIAYLPGAPAIAPPRRPEPPKIDVDSDGDGLLDSADKCPSEAEDKDLFDDSDGCPDKDNDRDGIADADDKCPLDAEDKDGFQDTDGCPDKDNDGDGSADAQDKCPNDAEDKDGFQDLDGCPDLDNDRDGIADAQDRCPNDPETINGNKDEDGCPDKGDSTIVLSPDRIATLDPILFNGTKLTRPSITVLAQVGATLRAHGEIVRVRITVHVQPTADGDADQAKSDSRAQTVRDWLIKFGIAQSRLEVRGFGGAKPLVPPDQRGAARINDRIELIILERK